MNRKTAYYSAILFIGLALASYFYLQNQPSVSTAFDPMAVYEAKHAPADHFFLQRSFPDGKYDLKQYKKAMKQVSQKAQQLARSNNSSAYNSDWTTQGPGNTGARVNTIAIHPTNEDTLYAGFSGGGIFKTNDGGSNWFPIFDEHPYLAIGDIVLDPTNPNTIYVGTGDPSISGYPFIGDGVYKSTDAGMNWTQSGLSLPGIISKIEIDPTNTNIVYAASMGIPFERNFERGVYKSIDGGDNWIQVFNIDDSTGVIDLLVHPDNPQLLIAAGWTRIRNNQESITSGSGHKLFRSLDGGETWAALDGGLPSGDVSRIGLAMSELDPDIIFALYISNSFNVLGIYKTTDAGETWSEVSNNSTFGLTNVMAGMGWYFSRMRVDPTNNERLYVLGVRAVVSPNGGSGWSNLTPTGTGAPHVDNHELVFSHSGNIYLGTDGGIYKQTVGSSTWEDIENIPTTQVYRTAYNPHQPNTYYAGCQDNGTHSGNLAGINSWGRLTGGDGFQMAFHPDDPNIRYVETQNGNILVTTNGSSYQIGTFGIDPADRRNWDMQYIISHFDPSHLYTGTQRMYKNTNNAVSDWVAISDDLTDGNIFGAPFHTISTLDESPMDSLTLYAGTTDANVWKSVDGGGNWIQIDATLPERYVTSIKAAPDFEEQVYVTFSGYKYNDNTPLIYHSTDRGDNWTAINGDLPDLAINDLYVMPNNDGNVLFVATDGGVYATCNAGTEWNRLGGNFPVVPVYDLDLNVENNLLIAATYARSILTFPLDSIGVTIDPPEVVAVGGTILAETGEIIDSIQVNISNGLEALVNTGISGAYQFPAVPVVANCIITPEKDIRPLNGVNLLDVFLIQKHILDIEVLDSPYKMIAADANNSGGVNLLDIFALQKLILFIDTEFQNNTSWRFIRSNHTFINPLNPWQDTIPEVYYCSDLTGDLNMIDFVGLKVGDLNASVNLSQLEGGDTRETLVWETEDIAFNAGEKIQLDFTAKDVGRMAGFQFNLGFDPNTLTLDEILSGTFDAEPIQFGKTQLDQGILLGLWSNAKGVKWTDETILFSLIFTTQKTGQSREVVELRSDYTGKLALRPNGELMDLALDFKSKPATSLPEIIALNAYPNPFTDYTLVEWTLADAQEVACTIYNLKGQKVWTTSRFAEAGRQMQQLDRALFPNSGIYFFELRYGTTVQRKKLILSR